MVDPDHPLAALVRKAQADSSAPAPPTADGTPAQPSQVEYTADCEYPECPVMCLARSRRPTPHALPYRYGAIIPQTSSVVQEGGTWRACLPGLWLRIPERKGQARAEE